jgi:hypothetical protein
LLRAVEQEEDGVRFYGERAENGGSARGLAEEIARFLAAVRAVGWWNRVEGLRPNDNLAWTVALDIYRRCGEGDIDGATAELDEAETIGQSSERASITDALQRKIPEAIVSGKMEHPEESGASRDPAGTGGAEGVATPSAKSARQKLMDALAEERRILQLSKKTLPTEFDYAAATRDLWELWRAEVGLHKAPPEKPRPAPSNYQEAADALDLFQRAVEALPETPAPADASTDREQRINNLSKAIRLAWRSYEFAALKLGKSLDELTGPVAYEFLKEVDFRDDREAHGELNGYRLPRSFATWDRYLRSARKALEEPKHTCRRGRTHGRSIVPRDQIEQPEQDE